MIPIERELKLTELILTAKAMLKGQEGVDFVFFEEDKAWWELRLYLRRN